MQFERLHMQKCFHDAINLFPRFLLIRVHGEQQRTLRHGLQVLLGQSVTCLGRHDRVVHVLWRAHAHEGAAHVLLSDTVLDRLDRQRRPDIRHGVEPSIRHKVLADQAQDQVQLVVALVRVDLAEAGNVCHKRPGLAAVPVDPRDNRVLVLLVLGVVVGGVFEDFEVAINGGQDFFVEVVAGGEVVGREAGEVLGQDLAPDELERDGLFFD